MNRDPFLRFAFVVLVSLYVLGIVLLWRWLGHTAALIVAALGFGTAMALTYEPSPPKPETDPHRRQRQPAEGTRGFLRTK